MTTTQMDECLSLMIKGLSQRQAAIRVGVTPKTARNHLRTHYPAQYEEILAASHRKSTTIMAEAREAKALDWLKAHLRLALEVIREHRTPVACCRVLRYIHGYQGTQTVLWDWWKSQTEHAATMAKHRHTGKKRRVVRQKTSGGHANWLFEPTPIDPMDHPKLKPLRRLVEMPAHERARLEQRASEVLTHHLGRMVPRITAPLAPGMGPMALDK